VSSVRRSYVKVLVTEAVTLVVLYWLQSAFI
jgi:hypothetical protein